MQISKSFRLFVLPNKLSVTAEAAWHVARMLTVGICAWAASGQRPITYVIATVAAASLTTIAATRGLAVVLALISSGAENEVIVIRCVQWFCPEPVIDPYICSIIPFFDRLGYRKPHDERCHPREKVGTQDPVLVGRKAATRGSNPYRQRAARR
jgi:hypothetical protein